MGVLRKTIQRVVFDILDSSVFTSDDFEVSFGDPKKSQYLILIKFRHHPEYLYSISKVSDPILYVKRRPGDFEEEEGTNCNGLENALKGIDNWCKEVRNELRASQPLYNEIDQLKKVIEEHITSGDNDEFSAEDIFILRKKFQDLEKRVETLEQDKIITETQLNEFKSGLKQVSEDLEFYPKTTWVRTAANKMVKIVMSIGKSKEGRALITDGARKLLGFE